MYKAIEFAVKGVAPLLMHNERLANPLDPIAIEIRKITAKRKKTLGDYEHLAGLEWQGGIHIDEKGHPCVPGHVIEGTLINAAKKLRMGPSAKAGLICDGSWPLEYDGPKDGNKLKAVKSFRDIRRVVVQRQAVMRCRPIFYTWAVTFTLHYLPSLFDEEQVVDLVRVGGRIIGLMDYRPKFGRYEIENWQAVKQAAVA